MRRLCPVRVAKKLHNAALRQGRTQSHATSVARQGQVRSKRAATLTFQKLAVDTTVARVSGHWLRWRSLESTLIQASCRWDSRAMVGCIRDCHLSSAVDVVTRVTRGQQLMEVRENIHQYVKLEVGTEHVWKRRSLSWKGIEDQGRQGEVCLCKIWVRQVAHQEERYCVLVWTAVDATGDGRVPQSRTDGRCLRALAASLCS